MITAAFWIGVASLPSTEMLFNASRRSASVTFKKSEKSVSCPAPSEVREESKPGGGAESFNIFPSVVKPVGKGAKGASREVLAKAVGEVGPEGAIIPPRFCSLPGCVNIFTPALPGKPMKLPLNIVRA